MKSTQSRIQASEVEDPQLENSRFPETVETIASSESVASTPKPNVDLDETASALGVESDFQKATQAVLRMIARNGGKLTFPLEVDQNRLNQLGYLNKYFRTKYLIPSFFNITSTLVSKVYYPPLTPAVLMRRLFHFHFPVHLI